MPKTGPTTAESAFHTNFIDVHPTIKLTSGHTGVRQTSISEGLLEESYRAQRYHWLVCPPQTTTRYIETHLLKTSFATVRGQATADCARVASRTRERLHTYTHTHVHKGTPKQERRVNSERPTYTWGHAQQLCIYTGVNHLKAIDSNLSHLPL